MSILPRLASFVRNLFLRERVERDLDDEVRNYLDMLTDEQVEAGLPAKEARREAARQLGGLEPVKEQVRQARTGRLLENLIQDLRYGLRTLVAAPAFTGVAILSLALGIGGSAAMFSLVNNALIRPLPFSDPDQLVRITQYYPRGGVEELRTQAKSMDVAAYTTDSEFNVTGQGTALHLTGSSTTANLFSLLGVEAEVGRTIRLGEDRPGADRIVVLSHGLWRAQFGGDPNIVGRPIMIDGSARQVVGVMPPGFSFPSPAVQLWVPFHLDPGNPVDYWESGWVPVIGRLHAGQTLGRAQSELKPIVSHIIGLLPFPAPSDWNSNSTVVGLQQDLVGDVRTRLLVLMYAVGFVMLIGCANVASLLLAKAASRQREIAIRTALGAGRGRIVRQLLTESVLIGIAGGAAGLLLALGGVEALKTALPQDIPRLAEAGVDWRVLAFTTALAISTGLAFGLVPAISASRINLAESIKTRGQQSQGLSGVRLRGFLIAGEVMLAVVLLIGAGLLIRSLWLLTRVNPGFRSEQILTVRVFPDRTSYPNPETRLALYDRLLGEAKRISGVSDVAAANTIPLSRDIPAVAVEAENHPASPSQRLDPMFWAGAVTLDYFRIMGIQLLEGRTFTEADSARAAPVIIVDAETARRYWPNQNPVGKHIRLVWESTWRTIVGVAGDVRQYDLGNSSPAYIGGALYMPYPQAEGIDRQLPSAMTLLIRGSADPVRVGMEMRSMVANLDPNLPVSGVQPMGAVVQASMSEPRSLAWLFISFAASALILATIGTYGVVSYSTSQRMSELGLRLALGATRKSLFVLVLRQSIGLVAAGLLAGAIGSLALTRLLIRFLYGITPTDPVTFAAVAALLVAAAILAGYFPARKAAGADPMSVLGSE
ncbi:MAG TPA: ABC transporter permease [Blastocatellia bacterium]|nr:ABC transporter permease [Blastocatellia bacterium]